MINWRVRAAVETDKAAVVALEAAAFGPASWGASGVAEGFNERTAKKMVATAPDETAIEGFAFWRAAGEEAEILSIGVAPRARRRGCALALMTALIDAAREGGVRRLFLEVDVGNASAAALYRACGFAVVGRRKRYYRNGGDALVMRLDL